MSSVSQSHIQDASAAIAQLVRSTPVIELESEAFNVNCDVVAKLEFTQHTGSFKARGASHFLATQSVGGGGVAAASGGNHGAAVAWAARQFGHSANIFVPNTAPGPKVARLREYGATVHQSGSVYADALAASVEFREASGAVAVEAFDDPVVMAGAGTCAMEFEAQAGPLDAVLIACGGGGLSGSFASWFGDRTEIVAIETPGTSSYRASKEAGEIVSIEVNGLAADALGATQLGGYPWEALTEVGATSVIVSDDDLVEARRVLWDRCRMLVELSAAAPIAALMTKAWKPRSPKDRVGIVLCGANTEIG